MGAFIWKGIFCKSDFSSSRLNLESTFRNGCSFNRKNIARDFKPCVVLISLDGSLLESDGLPTNVPKPEILGRFSFYLVVVRSSLAND